MTVETFTIPRDKGCTPRVITIEADKVTIHHERESGGGLVGVILSARQWEELTKRVVLRREPTFILVEEI